MSGFYSPCVEVDVQMGSGVSHTHEHASGGQTTIFSAISQGFISRLLRHSLLQGPGAHQVGLEG